MIKSGAAVQKMIITCANKNLDDKCMGIGKIGTF